MRQLKHCYLLGLRQNSITVTLSTTCITSVHAVGDKTFWLSNWNWIDRVGLRSFIV